MTSVYIDSHIITLTSDSATTINGTLLSDANFEFRGLLKDELDIVQRQISIISAQIPVSFYNINEYNNIFEGRINVSTNFTCTIPLGNYNANSLCLFLNTFITALGFPTITFSIDKITGKLIWKYPNPTDDPTRALLFKKESICQEIFGFQKEIDYSGTSYSIGGGNSYVELRSVYPMNLLGAKVLSIKSPSLNTTNFSSVYKSANTLLATIPVDATLFGQIDYHNYANLKTSFNNTDLNSLEIQIYDENNNLVDFNGVNWAITLAIHLTRRYAGDTQPLANIEATLQGHSQDFRPSVEPNVKPKVKELSPEDQILFS